MSDAFDPYHAWLGIPPSEQPADYYRLLGVRRFESDPEVIQVAADRQMAYVQRCKIGPHSALSQRILNELAAARVGLLNPEKRVAYDRSLLEADAQRQQAELERQRVMAASGPPQFAPASLTPAYLAPGHPPSPPFSPPGFPAVNWSQPVAATVAAGSQEPSASSYGYATTTEPIRRQVRRGDRSKLYLIPVALVGVSLVFLVTVLFLNQNEPVADSPDKGSNNLAAKSPAAKSPPNKPDARKPTITKVIEPVSKPATPASPTTAEVASHVIAPAEPAGAVKPDPTRVVATTETIIKPTKPAEAKLENAAEPTKPPETVKPAEEVKPVEVAKVVIKPAEPAPAAAAAERRLPKDAYEFTAPVAPESVQVSNNGKLVIVCEQRMGRLFAAETGNEIGEARKNAVVCGFLPDGRTPFTAPWEGPLTLLDPTTGEKAGQGISGFQTKAVTFSRDGRLAAVGQWRGGVAISEMPSGPKKDVKVFGRNDSIEGIAFSRDGKRLLTVTKNLFKVIDVRTGEESGSIDTRPSMKLGVLPDGRIVSAGLDGSHDLEIREFETGRNAGVWQGHSGSITAVAVSSQGDCASVSDDKTARLWETDSGNSKVIWKHDAELSSASFSADGSALVLAGRDGKVKVMTLAKAAK